MRRLIQLIISAALTVLIGYLIYRQVPDWGQSFHVMIQGNPLLLFAGLCFAAFHILLRAKRWGVLLAPSKKAISLKNLLSLTLVKYVINVIPPRTGEVAASIVLAKKENISAATVIAASFFERILDALTVLVFFIYYLVAVSQHYAPREESGRTIILSVRDYSLKAFIVLGIGFFILILLFRSTHWSKKIPLKIRRPALHFLEGFRVIQSQGAILQAILLSLAIWLSITLQLWCLVQAYLRSFPFAGTILIVVLTVVGVAIPTPGGIGGFQYFMNMALVNFFWQHLSAQDAYSQATGISNGCYLVSMVPVIVAGLIFLNREGLSFGRASKLSER